MGRCMSLASLASKLFRNFGGGGVRVLLGVGWE